MMQEPTNTATEMPDEPQGIDSIIARVDQYLAKPEMVTPDTLMELRTELEDLKTVLDGDNSGEQAPPAPGPQGGLAGMMGGR